MSFAEQLRSIYVSEQPGANSTYDTNLIFAGVYNTTVRECTRQAAGYISVPPTPPNINWRGAWSVALTYAPGDGVTDLGISYVCILLHSGIQPPSALFWAVYTAPTRSFTLDVTATTAAVAAVTAMPRPEQGGGVVTWRGGWNNYTEYVLNDAVTYQGASYVCSTPNLNLPPFPPGAYWYSPVPSDPIYKYVPQTGTYVATPQDLLVIRDKLIKKLTSTDMGLTVVPAGPINITISW